MISGDVYCALVLEKFCKAPGEKAQKWTVRERVRQESVVKGHEALLQVCSAADHLENTGTKGLGLHSTL